MSLLTCASNPRKDVDGHGGVPKEQRPPHHPKKPLKRVLRTPQMVVKVRDCPASQMPIELCYQCFGDPNDGLPPVLLICGLNMQLYAWDEDFCEALVRAGFYVIRYDNRDMGHSTKVEHRGRVKAPLLLLPGGAASFLGERLPYGVEDMAADAWALLDTLNIPCAHLFGISMGGMIAQTAALLAPERTISLTSVMSSTNAADLPQPQMWVKLWMLRKPPRDCTVDELLEFRVDSLRRLLRSALPPDGDYLKKRFLMSLKRSSYSAGLLRQAATIRRAAGRDAALQKLYVPALVVHGAQDVVVPPMHGYRTATMLPYARMLVLKSMGHYFHPAFFSTIIEAFADMAASTDPAKRSLCTRLPSAQSLPLADAPALVANTEDGNVSAAAAWRRGGGCVSASHSALDYTEWAVNSGSRSAAGVSPLCRQSTTAADQHKSPVSSTTSEPDRSASHKESEAVEKEEEEEEEEVREPTQVDPMTRMMASMGAFIQPIVADASSPIGIAVCSSVMVAVPGGNSNPGVPEAVILENMFLRTPNAVPSVPTTTVVRKPAANMSSPTTNVPIAVPPTSTHTLTGINSIKGSESYSTSSAAGRVGSTPTTHSNKVVYSPLAKMPPPSPAAGGGVSAGQRAAGILSLSLSSLGSSTSSLPKPLPMDGAAPYVPRSPSRWHEIDPFPRHNTAAVKRPVTEMAAAAQSSTSTASLSGGRAYPQFHPQVVGVPVSEYLDTHPMERETSGLAITASFAAARTFDSSKEGSERNGASRREGNEASWISATALHEATPADLHTADGAPFLERAQREAVEKEKDNSAANGCGQSISSAAASRCSSQERRENESFLQLQAPEELVEATALPSL